jgi:hypothetical protein
VVGGIDGNVMSANASRWGECQIAELFVAAVRETSKRSVGIGSSWLASAISLA